MSTQDSETKFAQTKSASRDLPEDHLATTTKDGHRVYLYPADVEGRFRNMRVVFQGFLLVFFLAMPWVHINGHQAILLDIPQRRFSILGLTFWAHDAPMLFFVFGGGAITLALVTAIWGRIWCGWACPQTVFVDGVFRKLERWIEGKPAYRRMLDQGPWTAEKAFKKGAKWAAFIAITLLITHSFLAYFVGTKDLMTMITRSPFENWTSFLVMATTSLFILFDFGWFREQFCVIACPYGRLQSVLMDDNSMVVAYDAERGEPRKGSSAAAQGKQGDCVNCYRCVQVCPTGVDIRRGVQMECIACTACIDACDDMMTKLKKPIGLIRYDSFLGLHHKKAHPLRIRTIIYSSILVVAFSGIVYLVSNRKALDFVVLRAIDTPYQLVEDSVINHFKVDLNNQTFDEMEVRLDPIDPNFELITSSNPVKIPGGKDKRIDFFVKFKKGTIGAGGKTQLKVTYRSTTKADANPVEKVAEIKLVGPIN